MSPADLVRVLVEPFTEPIVQRAAAGVVLLGIVGGLAGCWVVLYGLSYAAESLAHGSLPGLVVAVAAGLPLLIGTSGGLLVAAAAIALVARVPALGRDTAVSIVISTMLPTRIVLPSTRVIVIGSKLVAKRSLSSSRSTMR